MRRLLSSGRATATIADQAFSSISNFLVGVVVARLAGPAGFGAFTLAFTVWLVVAGVHRSLIVKPVMIAPARDRPGPKALEGALAAEVLLGSAAGAIVAAAGGLLWAGGARQLGIALLGLAPWLAVLLVQDLWRWAGFMRAQPVRSLVNDIVFTVVQVGLLVAMGIGGSVGVMGAIAAWGVGAAAGSVLGAVQFGVRLRPGRGWACLRSSWGDGRWLLAEFLTSYASTQAYMYSVAGFLGPAALGLVRAAQNLMGPTHVLLMGGSSYGLPQSVEAYRARGWAGVDRVMRRVTLWATAGIGAYALVLVLTGEEVARLVYGTGYAGLGPLIALAGLQYVVAAGFAPGLGLTAVRRTGALFAVRAGAAVASVGLTVALARPLGAVGAGCAGVATAAVSALSVWAVYLRARAPGPDLTATVRRAPSGARPTEEGT